MSGSHVSKSGGEEKRIPSREDKQKLTSEKHRKVERKQSDVTWVLNWKQEVATNMTIDEKS